MKSYYVLNTETRGVIPIAYSTEQLANEAMYKLRATYVIHSYMIICYDSNPR